MPSMQSEFVISHILVDMQGTLEHIAAYGGLEGSKKSVCDATERSLTALQRGRCPMSGACEHAGPAERTNYKG
jgi:hypothetical protein